MTCNPPIDRIPDSLWAAALEAYLDYVQAVYAMDCAVEQPPQGKPGTVLQLLERAYTFLKQNPDHAYAMQRTAELRAEYQRRLDDVAAKYDRFRECIGAMMECAEGIALQRIQERAQTLMSDELRQVRGYPAIEETQGDNTEKIAA